MTCQGGTEAKSAKKAGVFCKKRLPLFQIIQNCPFLPELSGNSGNFGTAPAAPASGKSGGSPSGQGQHHHRGKDAVVQSGLHLPAVSLRNLPQDAQPEAMLRAGRPPPVSPLSAPASLRCCGSAAPDSPPGARASNSIHAGRQPWQPAMALSIRLEIRLQSCAPGRES